MKFSWESERSSIENDPLWQYISETTLEKCCREQSVNDELSGTQLEVSNSINLMNREPYLQKAKKQSLVRVVGRLWCRKQAFWEGSAKISNQNGIQLLSLVWCFCITGLNLASRKLLHTGTLGSIATNYKRTAILFFWHTSSDFSSNESLCPFDIVFCRWCGLFVHLFEYVVVVDAVGRRKEADMTILRSTPTCLSGHHQCSCTAPGQRHHLQRAVTFFEAFCLQRGAVL